MRTVIMLSFVALLVASISASGADPVSVGGDFGTAWLKNQPYESTAASEDAGGLWSWGDVPEGHMVVDGVLAPVENTTDTIDSLGIGWLGSEPPNASQVYTSPTGYFDYMYPFYSDDPWVLAQHYEVPITTDLSFLPEDQQDEYRDAWAKQNS